MRWVGWSLDTKQRLQRGSDSVFVPRKLQQTKCREQEWVLWVRLNPTKPEGDQRYSRIPVMRRRHHAWARLVPWQMMGRWAERCELQMRMKTLIMQGSSVAWSGMTVGKVGSLPLRVEKSLPQVISGNVGIDTTMVCCHLIRLLGLSQAWELILCNVMYSRVVEYSLD